MGLQFPLSFGRQNISKSWHLLDTQVSVWPATAGQVSVAGPPLWLSTGMGPSSAEMESTLSMAFARRRDLLRPSLRPTMAMEDTVGMALAMEAMAMGVLDTVMARGLLTLRLMPTTAMEDMDLGMALAMAMVVLAMVMARGLLTLRLTHTMAMVDMDLDMALAMADTAMGVLATVMARGRLIPSLTMV